MTVERTVCKYSIFMHTAIVCGHPTVQGKMFCGMDKCDKYTPLMYKPEEVK